MVSRRNFLRLTGSEISSGSEIYKRRLFDEAIRTVYDESLSIQEIPGPNHVEDKYFIFNEYEGNCDTPEENPVGATDKDVS